MRPSRKLNLGIFFFAFLAGIFVIGPYGHLYKASLAAQSWNIRLWILSIIILVSLINATILVGYTQKKLGRKFSITLASLVALSLIVIYFLGPGKPLMPPRGARPVSSIGVDHPLINFTTFPALMIFLHEQTNRFEWARKILGQIAAAV